MDLDEMRAERPGDRDVIDAHKARMLAEQEAGKGDVYVIFDGPPGHESGRFVECENAAGESIYGGDWIERPGGLWALRIHRGVSS